MQAVAGRNPVRELLELDPQRVERLLVQHGAGGRSLDRILKAARKARVEVQEVAPGQLRDAAPGVNHQGVVALARRIGYLDLEELIARTGATPEEVRTEQPVLVVLDEIQDPHNYGAILRSAVASGAAGVVVPQHRMAPLSAVTVKASAGTASRIPIAEVTNVAQALLRLKEAGYWAVGAEGGTDSTSAWAYDWRRPVALVIGSEGSGLRRLVGDTCDDLVAIPMPGPAESLNASVAAGVLLFAAARAREEAVR